jgi:ligand-binding sensor domain-containing protein
MRWAAILLFVLATFVSSTAFSQEYSFTHYDIGDGLASSTVYCIAQDREGFIWVGTEAGVCRFDGTHFRTFTTADGLPDAEILQIFGDSKGRVWMAPFRKAICYYYEGRVHNVDNDSLLSGMGLQGDVRNFAEDARGNMLILQKTAIYVVRRDGHFRRYDSAAGKPITGSMVAGRSVDGNFNVQIRDKLFDLSDTGFSFVRDMPNVFDNVNFTALSPSWAIFLRDFSEYQISSLVGSQSETYPSGYPAAKQVSLSILDDSLLYFNQISGVLEYSMPRGIVSRRLLQGIQVSRTFGDHAGNLWFTTLGNGIFRLNSEEIRTIRLPENGLGGSSAHSIALNMKGDELLVGDNHSEIYSLSIRDMKLSRKNLGVIHKPGRDRILFIHQFQPRKYIWGGDNDVDISDYNIHYHFPVSRGIKSACMMDANRVLLGGPWGAAIFDLRNLRITDKLWDGRITAVYSNNDTNYIGTMQGLWQIVGKRPAVFMGTTVPFLRSRVAALTETGDGNLWIASYDDSVIGYANGRVVATITSKQGLTGNICHCLYLHDHILWVGTDKGLNKIELDKPGYPVSCYTSNDGLASDVINVVYAVGSTIFVGTSAGLSYFDESKAHTGDECRLNLVAIISGGHDRISDTSTLLLPVRENNIRFEFAGISYRSGGKISYRYRLIGLDSTWKGTQDNYLAYPTLPGGKYEFQIQAINRFGIPSEMRRVPFVVATPFWNELWFNGLELLTFLALTWLFAGWRTRRVRRQQEERSKQSRRMVELEHIALQAQMNPHFIFNCLNSIQQFVFDKDMMATNEYISSFSRLIRATLNHSSRPFISVAEEVEYLTDYLSLEKMRFKNKMNYFVEVEPGIDTDDLLLPPMLLQPYVENCVRHGLRHKTNGQGYISILFRKLAEKLTVTIRDNGIGRKKAREYKTGEHIEYQSKGMSLTLSRIQMINVLYKSQIEVTVEDMLDDKGQPDGTRIVIEFPVFQ